MDEISNILTSLQPNKTLALTLTPCTFIEDESEHYTEYRITNYTEYTPPTTTTELQPINDVLGIINRLSSFTEFTVGIDIIILIISVTHDNKIVIKDIKVDNQQTIVNMKECPTGYGVVYRLTSDEKGIRDTKLKSLLDAAADQKAEEEAAAAAAAAKKAKEEADAADQKEREATNFKNLLTVLLGLNTAEKKAAAVKKAEEEAARLKAEQEKEAARLKAEQEKEAARLKAEQEVAAAAAAKEKDPFPTESISDDDKDDKKEINNNNLLNLPHPPDYTSTISPPQPPPPRLDIYDSLMNLYSLLNQYKTAAKKSALLGYTLNPFSSKMSATDFKNRDAVKNAYKDVLLSFLPDKNKLVRTNERGSKILRPYTEVLKIIQDTDSKDLINPSLLTDSKDLINPPLLNKQLKNKGETEQRTTEPPTTKQPTTKQLKDILNVITRNIYGRLLDPSTGSNIDEKIISSIHMLSRLIPYFDSKKKIDSKEETYHNPAALNGYDMYLYRGNLASYISHNQVKREDILDTKLLTDSDTKLLTYIYDATHQSKKGWVWGGKLTRKKSKKSSSRSRNTRQTKRVIRNKRPIFRRNQTRRK